MAMLLILVAMSMSALLAPLVFQQITATRTGSAYARALQAAQGGIDVALGQLRAANAPDATTPEIDGQLEDLPGCAFNGDVNVGSDLPPMAYQVTIAYRNVDGGVMDCPPHDVPTTASLVSIGRSGSAVRTVTGTYTFITSNQNISGGAVRISSPGNLCMDAGSNSVPAPNDPVKMLTCEPGNGRQRFAYTSDVTLQLVGSSSSAAPNGMCLDGGSPLVAGTVVVFQPCGNRLPRQQWSLDGVSVWHGTNDGIKVENICLNMARPGEYNSDVVLGWCGGNGSVTQFRADTTAGAGMSGPVTGQLVNFMKFNQCIDVPGSNPVNNYLIVYACKQAPNGIVEPNQRLFYSTPAAPETTVTTQIRTVRDTINYCLQSPQAVNLDVTTPPCATAPVPSATQWTMYGKTGDYATSYQVVDASGYCLTAAASRVRVAVCDGSEAQKWNADPNITQPTPLTDIREN